MKVDNLIKKKRLRVKSRMILRKSINEKYRDKLMQSNKETRKSTKNVKSEAFPISSPPKNPKNCLISKFIFSILQSDI